jgi:hypothetical protein
MQYYFIASILEVIIMLNEIYCQGMTNVIKIFTLINEQTQRLVNAFTELFFWVPENSKQSFSEWFADTDRLCKDYIQVFENHLTKMRGGQ